MRALNNIIILEEIKEETVLDSGLIIPENESKKMKYNKGKVITFGPDVKAVQEGDVIYYDKHRAYSTAMEGRDVTVIREIDGIVVVD